MTNQKGEKPNYIGTLVLFILIMFAFIKYDDFSSIESIENGSVKGRTLSVILYCINITTIGYIIGHGTFLGLAIYRLRKLFVKFKNRSK